MATFGRTTIASQTTTSTGNLIRGSKFTLSEKGSVTSLSWYGSKTVGDTLMKCAVYDNTGAGAKAGNLLITSAEVTINSVTDQWWTFSVSPAVILVAGDYWLEFAFDNNTINIWFENVDNEDYQSITYPTIPSPWGVTHNTTTKDYSIYATYTPIVGSFLPLL